MMAKMKQSFYKNLPAIEDTENNIPPATGKIEKNAGDVLTGTAECATVCVTGLETRQTAEAAAITGDDPFTVSVRTVAGAALAVALLALLLAAVSLWRVL